ncbi:MAG: pilus motility taxis protein HmpF [Jaaginema sp. PMC 1079.18]|nr:pilus motility taxis protein HmpF [Jaaginema sp. PMC 1080.18]MEC4850286.1 pilus motility taxis protein HmpF [Jaaginema sp. PMC 1079.18]MEC4867391.1 pilus motility taxis protein HmpF [Jaaginema sp. PMC 1078.18]
MLYLAEVKKQKSGFMGKASTELKLLACQRNDQTWSAVPGEEIVPCDAAGDFESGAMVLVNLSGNRQVQGAPEPGGSRIVSILQNFSKLISDRKNQEEEIEAWNQSLTIQAQALSQKEMELEAEWTQLEQMREEAAGLEEKLQAAQEVKAESSKLQEEFERKNQELEQAWEHLRGEQRRLEERQSEIQSNGGGLTAEQTAQIQELFGSLETSTTPDSELQNHLQAALSQIREQQEYCQSQLGSLEQQRSEAEGQQAEADRQMGELQERRQQAIATLEALQQAKDNLQSQRLSLAVKQETINRLNQEIETQTNVYQSLSQLASGAGAVDTEESIDIESLENMPLGELQQIVESLQNDLNKSVQFVNDQEEELSLEKEELNELKGKVENANDYDRINLEQELADAQDRYQMLNETLMGQRREVRKQESKLGVHLRTLRRRQGIVDVEGSSPAINLNPVLEDLEEKQKERQEQLQTLENELKGIQTEIEQLEGQVQQYQHEQAEAEQGIQELETSCQDLQTSAAQMWAKFHAAQDTLQPIQDALAEIQPQLEALAQAMAQKQQEGENQQSAIATLKETINSI